MGDVDRGRTNAAGPETGKKRSAGVGGGSSGHCRQITVRVGAREGVKIQLRGGDDQVRITVSEDERPSPTFRDVGSTRGLYMDSWNNCEICCRDEASGRWSRLPPMG